MARLRSRIKVTDASGNNVDGAVLKLYEPGTATVTGLATSGTPFASALYAGPAGGPDLGHVHATDANGEAVLWTEARQRYDLGIEDGTSAQVFAYEEFSYDPADIPTVVDLVPGTLVTLTGVQTLTNKTLTAPTITTPAITSPTVTGVAEFANGSAAAPSVKIGSNGAGFYRPGAGLLGIPAGGLASFVFDSAAIPAGPRAYISEAALTKSALTLTRGDLSVGGAITPDATYEATLMASSVQKGGGASFKASTYAWEAQAAEGFMTAIQGVVEASAGGTWTPPGAGLHGFIALLGNVQSYKDSSRLWAGDLIARQFAGAGSAMTGLEVGVQVSPGATMQDRYGIQIVTLSEGGGTVSNENVGLKFADKMDPTDEDNLWDYLIGFGSPDIGASSVGVPVKATGTLIKSFGNKTIAGGIDFTGHNFSSFAFRTDFFVVNSAGRVAIKVGAVSGVAPLRMDANGDTYNILIDNPVLAGGAGAGADRHFVMRLGTETVIFTGKVQ